MPSGENLFTLTAFITFEALPVSSILVRLTYWHIYTPYRLNIKHPLFRFNSSSRTWFGIVSFLKSLCSLLCFLVLQELEQKWDQCSVVAGTDRKAFLKKSLSRGRTDLLETFISLCWCLEPPKMTRNGNLKKKKKNSLYVKAGVVHKLGKSFVGKGCNTAAVMQRLGKNRIVCGLWGKREIEKEIWRYSMLLITTKLWIPSPALKFTSCTGLCLWFSQDYNVAIALRERSMERKPRVKE